MNGKIIIADYFELFKFNLCAYISLSAIFGHVMAQQSFSAESFYVGFFVLILASGSAILNNIQDREYDLFFFRTRNRALPQKKVPIFHAFCLCFFMMGAGLSGLAIIQGLWPFALGGLAVIFYNGLYTPIKKNSLLAIVPGSVTGMLPPLIGWSCVGKSLMVKEILLIMGIFGLWQVAHFFIILLKAKKDIASIDGNKIFPCFTKLFSKNEIKLQVLIWTSLYSLAIILFLITGPITNTVLSFFIGINAIMILLILIAVMIQQKKNNSIYAFMSINLSMLFFMAAGIGDKCIL